MASRTFEDYSLRLTQEVQWGEMDSFNHVNNSVYFRYFENARIAYFEQTGINRFMKEHIVGPILGSTECKFLAPLTYPDTIDICTRVMAVKEKRFTMEYLVYSRQLNREAAVGSGEIVYFDYSTNKTTPIPESILDNIKMAESKRVEF